MFSLNILDYSISFLDLGHLPDTQGTWSMGGGMGVALRF